MALSKEAVQEAARLLIAARRTGNLVETLPEGCRPGSAADAHAIQDATVAGLGEAVGGWKVSAPAGGEVVRGVILNSRIFPSPARVPAKLVPLLGVEAEIAFRFDRDLPARVQAYSQEEVAAAVTAIAAIEIVDSRFRVYREAQLLDKAADCVSNGGFVAGTAQPKWRGLDLVNLPVTLKIDGKTVVQQSGGHPAGDPILPAVALVNELRTQGGVRAGKIMTTGTYTGLNFAKPGQTVTAEFAGVGTAQVTFEA